MKTLIRILIVVVVIIAIPLIMALFIKNEYNVVREVIINKPKQEVFNYVKHLKNQDNYNYWTMMDPNLKKDFRGTDGTTGFVYAWEGEKAGKGEQEIKAITEGEKLELELRFIEPMPGVANTQLITESLAENQTKVKWRMNGSSSYPFNFMNLFMDSMLGKDLETSLASLKGSLEK